MSGGPFFVVRGLVRRPWIEGFSLGLRAGEVVALRAPSGSGKTLLMRALADLDPRDGGELRLDGVASDTLPVTAWRCAVHYVAPGGWRGEGTVRAALDELAALHAAGACAAPSASVAPAAWPDVPDVAMSAGIARLSSGESQRVALHAALCARPRVLLLDEATSALDAEAARRWEARVLDFAREGGAVLWTTHDAALVERVASRSVGLEGEAS